MKDTWEDPDIHGTEEMRLFAEKWAQAKHPFPNRVEWYPGPETNVEYYLIKFFQWLWGATCHHKPVINFKLHHEKSYPSGFKQEVLIARYTICQVCWIIRNRYGEVQK